MNVASLPVARAHVLERAKLQLRLLWEHGDVGWAPTIGNRVRAGELTTLDIEHLVDRGSVVEMATLGRGRHRLTLCGLSTIGNPAKFVIEIDGREGLITEVKWLS